MDTTETTLRGATRAPKTILVATDFDSCADAALDQALVLATALHAKVYLFHAYSLPIAAFPEGEFAPAAEIAPRIVASARASLDAAVDKCKRSGLAGEVDVEAVLERGDPSEAVLAAIPRLGADLVVLGTHGRRGLVRAILGSVAESLVRSSPVPVLTVHPAAA